MIPFLAVVPALLLAAVVGAFVLLPLAVMSLAAAVVMLPPLALWRYARARRAAARDADGHYAMSRQLGEIRDLPEAPRRSRGR